MRNEPWSDRGPMHGSEGQIGENLCSEQFIPVAPVIFSRVQVLIVLAHCPTAQLPILR